MKLPLSLINDEHLLKEYFSLQLIKICEEQRRVKSEDEILYFHSQILAVLVLSNMLIKDAPDVWYNQRLELKEKTSDGIRNHINELIIKNSIRRGLDETQIKQVLNINSILSNLEIKD